MAVTYPLYFPLSTSTREEALATLTHPSPEVWEIEMHNGVDNRLTVHFILNCLQKALDVVEGEWRAVGAGAPGALVLVGKKDQIKFFSNGESVSNGWAHLTIGLIRHVGLDYENASKDTNFTPCTIFHRVMVIVPLTNSYSHLEPPHDTSPQLPQYVQITQYLSLLFGTDDF